MRSSLKFSLLLVSIFTTVVTFEISLSPTLSLNHAVLTESSSSFNYSEIANFPILLLNDIDDGSSKIYPLTEGLHKLAVSRKTSASVATTEGKLIRRNFHQHVLAQNKERCFRL